MDNRAGLAVDDWAEQVAAALRRYRRAMRSALEASGDLPVPPAANWLLLAVSAQPGSVNDLANRLGIAKQAVSRLADRLVVLGYCDRRRSATNRRTVLLSATEHGARVASTLRQATRAIDATVVEHLDDKSLDAFRRGLRLLADPSILESASASEGCCYRSGAGASAPDRP